MLLSPRISDAERNNDGLRQQVEQERIAKKNICINEYMQTNSCLKGEDCRFRHEISEQERKCPKMHKNVTEKWTKVTGKLMQSTAIQSPRDVTELPPAEVVDEMRKLVVEVREWINNKRP